MAGYDIPQLSIGYLIYYDDARYENEKCSRVTMLNLVTPAETEKLDIFRIGYQWF
jgi:hypothetical protein